MKSLIPFITGYAPTRYCQGLDAMILKKAHSVDITKLRMVVLFDSEANHSNKWIGKIAMSKALELNSLAPK